MLKGLNKRDKIFYAMAWIVFIVILSMLVSGCCTVQPQQKETKYRMAYWYELKENKQYWYSK